jgi:transcriptional/translational regulatory protein YebC/TACO1
MGRSFENRKHAIFKTAAQKSKLYSKYGTQLYMAAKNLIEKAKKDQVPAHVIEKAIQKASGAGGEDFQPARYEGFGPGGSLVIVDCLTDNNQRTISEVRSCFTKTGSKLAANGSVTMSFDHLAVLSFKGDNEEEVMEALLEADVNLEEVESKDGYVTVFAPPSQYRAGNPGNHFPAAKQHHAQRRGPAAVRKVPQHAQRLRRCARGLSQRFAAGIGLAMPPIVYDSGGFAWPTVA